MWAQSSVQPYLVIRDHDDALGKVKLDKPVGHLPDLPGDRLVSADAYRRGTPPLGHGDHEQGEGLLGEGHVGVVQLAVDEVEGRADQLGDEDAVQPREVSRRQTCAWRTGLPYTMQQPLKYVAHNMPRMICIATPCLGSPGGSICCRLVAPSRPGDGMPSSASATEARGASSLTVMVGRTRVSEV